VQLQLILSAYVVNTRGDCRGDDRSDSPLVYSLQATGRGDSRHIDCSN